MSRVRSHKAQLREGQPDVVDVAVRLTKAQAAAMMALSGSIGGAPDGPRGDAQSGLELIGKAFGFEDYHEARLWLQDAARNVEFKLYGSITMDAKLREERRGGTDRRKANR